MSYFSNALQTVVDRTFGGKHTAISVAADLASNEIGRLVREETPCTAAKLAKLCAAPEIGETDRELLVTAAVRDFVPDELWKRLFSQRPEPSMESVLRETEPLTFFAAFPISPRAAQVLRHLITKAQSDPDVVSALELLGKFLELPEPL